MELRIEIKGKTQALVDQPEYEIQQMLEYVIDQAENFKIASGVLRDSNGNKVGTYSYHKN
jgi:hypothetical protein